MANYTKTKPGKPDAGKYTSGDTVKDSTGVVWKCIQSGIPGVWVPNSFNTAIPTLPSGVATTISLKDEGTAGFHVTTLTLSSVLTTVTDLLAYGSTQILDFPEGRIWVLGTIATLQVGANGVRASTINNSSTVDWALGTAAASNVALSATMVDLAPLSDEAVIGDDSALGTASSSVLTAAAFFDGTATAKDMFLNFGFSDATDIDADGVLRTSGTIQITWVHLGDK